jgi:DNA polymerase-3 subunit epsilon
MYAIVDIETTGGHASQFGITEIAVFIHDGNQVIKRFETLINPQQNIPSYITALTGINNAMVASAPIFEEIAYDLFEILNGQIFIAHNVNFDYSFIHHHLKVAGYELNVKKLCTVRLGRKVFPGLPSYSLGKLCRTLDLPIENRHRAGGDAQATVLLFEHCLANGADKYIGEMLKKKSSEQWLPMNLSKSAIMDLPSGPGVYYFHDEKDTIIYIGKAINIKKRVSSHFTHQDADKKRQQFIRTIFKITYQSCATELEAIVLESAEIKKLWPKHNTSQKKPTQKYALYMYQDGRGYQRLIIDKKKKNIPSLYSFNLLREGWAMLKKIVYQFDLNEKLCFIDKSRFTNQDYENLESASMYNLKIAKMLAALEQQLPTFAVVDSGRNEQEKLCLLIERGCFWGMGYLPSTMQLSSAKEIKNLLVPYQDNDTIRKSIYSFAMQYPHKRVNLQS